MARANQTWGEERIAGELLLKLGIAVSPWTIQALHAAADPVAPVFILADVEHVRAEPRPRDTGLRFLRDGHGYIPIRLRVPGAGDRHASHPALECHRTPHSRVDGAAVQASSAATIRIDSWSMIAMPLSR